MSDPGRYRSRPLKVLHLIVTLPVGGIEQRLKELVIRYCKEDFQPIVCCLRDKNVVGKEIEQYGIEVIELNRMRGHRFDPLLVWRLYRLMKERKIDIVRMHEYHANLYGRLAAQWAKVPVVVSSVHNVYRRKLYHRFWINRFLARWSDRVIAISERVKEDLFRFDRLPPAKVKVIPNGVDPLPFENPISKEEARKKLSLPEQALVIGTVGRLSIAKGHPILIEAFRLLLEEGGDPDLRLVLVGEGPLRESLEQSVRKWGLEKRVLFLGTRRDVPDCLRAFDLFVFSSLWEGQPAAIIEAMAAGLPIVSTEYEGVREIITDKVEALLVRPNDPKALKEGMVALLKDGALRQSLAEAARRRVVGQLSVHRIVQEYETLYKELLSGKGFSF